MKVSDLVALGEEIRKFDYTLTYSTAENIHIIKNALYNLFSIDCDVYYMSLSPAIVINFRRPYCNFNGFCIETSHVDISIFSNKVSLKTNGIHEEIFINNVEFNLGKKYDDMVMFRTMVELCK